MKRILSILTHLIGYSILLIVCLLLVSYYTLQLPEIQTRIANKATEWLGDELGGSITMSNIRVKSYDEIVIEDLNIKDNQDRNMIYAREVYVNAKTSLRMGLSKLFSYGKGKGLKSIGFHPESFVQFDNNFDFLTLKDPVVHFIKDEHNNLNFEYWLDEINRLIGKENKENQPATPFTIDHANIINGSIKITTDNSVRTTDGTFDFANFEFKNLNADLENLLFKRDTLVMFSNGLRAEDSFSDLKLTEVTGNFFYCKKELKLDNFVAGINSSVVTDRLYMTYDKPSDFQDFFQKVRLNGDLRSSVLHTHDLALFIPFLGQFDENYKISTRLNGTVDDLSLDDLILNFGKGSTIVGKAHFLGLPDIEKVYSTAQFEASRLLAEDVSQYSSNPQYQKYIEKIGRLDISGLFTGVYNNFNARPKLYSPNLGEVVGEVTLNAGETLEYSGNLLLNELKIGDLLDTDDLDAITFNGKINGTGRTLEEAIVHLDGYVSGIDFRNYNYKNIQVDGDLGQSLFEGSLKIDDPNILGDFTGRVDFNQEVNAYNFDGLLGFANLKALGIVNRDYKIRSRVDFDFDGNHPDDWLGMANFYEFNLWEDEKHLQVDSIAFYSNLVDQERRLEVASGFFDARLKGDFIPTVFIKEVITLAQEHKMYFENTEKEREEYYITKKAEGLYNTIPYHSEIEVEFNRPGPFFDFFTPGINVSKGTRFTGEYNSGKENSIHIAGSTDTLTIGINEFYDTFFDYYIQKEVLLPSIVNQLRVKSGIQKTGNDSYTEELVVNVNWEGTDTIDFRTFVTQLSTNSLLDLRGQLNFYQDGFKISLIPEQTHIQLIGLDWDIAENNSIDFKKQNITFENIGIKGVNEQEIKLNGKLSTNPDDLLELNVNAFKIETLKPFINEELAGSATGNLVLKDYYKDLVYMSNLHVEDFYYQNSLVGTVTTVATWDEAKDHLNLQLNIFQNMEEILRLDGYYDPKEIKDKLNLNGVLANTNLEMFMGMTGEVFSSLSGKADGKFKVKGTPSKPVFIGKIDITNGFLVIDVSGTELYFEDEILLTDKGFELPERGVVIKDAPNGNQALLTGGIYYKDAPGWDINLNADIDSKAGFKVMNIKNFGNDFFFGTTYAIGEINLSGDFNDLLISGNLTTKEGTHVVIPTDSDTKIDSKEEGIAFLKPEIQVDTLYEHLQPRKFQRSSGEIRLVFNLTLTPDADGEVIFDRVNNDILSLYGDGNVTVIFDSRGEFSITGPYNVHGGKYFFSFQNLASLRRFNISENSRITFNGDPFEAIIDITANYTTNIGINKISPQLSNSSARFPVTVTVNLTERLLTPTISYNIDFDEKQIPISGQTDILAFEQRLRTDEQLLSRNVSSILVFNEVSPENNMVDALSQQFLIDNISSLLSNQIGNLANKLDPNLEFGVRFGDFRENLLNNMQLDFSYKLLNNRIKLSGKGAFINSLEDNISNMTPSNYGQLSVGGEIEYMISDDGAYKFRLYSRSVPTNYYVFYSQGNVIVSGGNFIISRNFNSFFKNRNQSETGVGNMPPISQN